MPVVTVPVKNHIVARLQKLSLALIVCALACIPTLTAKAQAFPAFPNGNNNGFTNQGVSMGLAQFSSATANSLLMVYTTVGSPNVLALASSTNGTNFTPLQTLPGYSVYQHSNDPQAANAAICVFNGNAYIAYADNATDGLYVLKLSIIPGSSQFSVALAHTETGLHLTAAPGMAVAPDGRHLLIRYPTSSVSGVNNGTFTTEFDGITWNTQQSFGLTPQQPALVVFNSKLYAIDK